MAAGNTRHVELRLKCLCEAHTFAALVSQTSLPLHGTCCHCTSCRHVTGALYSSMVPWPGSVDEVRCSSLSRYTFSAALDILFCGVCSSPLFWRQRHDNNSEKFGFFTGSLVNMEDTGIVSITDHICVGDTLDGGASQWLRCLTTDSTESRRWKGRQEITELLDPSWPVPEKFMNFNDKSGPDNISIQCHCKGVDFVLRRGDADFAKQAADSLPFFVDPTTYKLVAGFDACNSCRSMFGVDIVNWTFSLLRHLDFGSSVSSRDSREFPKTTEQLKHSVLASESDHGFGTLAMYASSKDVQRYFCSRCSASIFYAVDDRPDLVDVAVGVLEAPEGARAESLLLWGLGSAVGGWSDAKGSWRESIVKGVKEAAEDWRIARGYPKTWRRIALEESQNTLT